MLLPQRTREVANELTLDDWRRSVRLRGHPDTAPQAGKSWGFGAWPDYDTTVELFGEEDGASCWYFRGRRFYCPSWAERSPLAADIRDPRFSRWNAIIVAQPEGCWRDFLAGPGTWVLSRLLRIRAAVFWSNWELSWDRLDCYTHRGWGMVAPDAAAPLFGPCPDGDALAPIELPTDNPRFADAVAACFLFASVGMRDCFLADASASEVYLATHEDYLIISLANVKSRRALLRDLWSAATVYVDDTGEAGRPDAQ